MACRTTLWWVLVLAVLMATSCGSGVAGGASPVGTPDPSNAADASTAVPGPTEESAADFAASVVGRLEQDAFYATDASFVEPFVASGAHEQVVGTLDATVSDVRWAIATLPGPTRRVWFVTAPLTVAVTAFDPNAGTASVVVWMVSVFSREDLGPPETRFSLEQADLTWDAPTGSWRIVRLTSAPGPTAALAADQIPMTPGELDTALSGHRLIPATSPRGKR